MHLVKNIGAKEGIVKEAFYKIQEHRQKFGEPVSILMGPNEYLSFCHELGGRVERYEGVIVQVKRTPGMDITINPIEAATFAIGHISNNPPPAS